MNKRFHKRALSATVALLTLTSAVSTADAAQRNEITIESSKSSVSAGEVFEVTMGFEPDSVGASGFTIDLHYDSEAVSLNLDKSAEYDTAGGFALVTNLEYADGTVRIVGANLAGENVTDDVELALLSFTVNEGFSGDIGFWTEVETLVAADGEDFYNADYRAFGPYDQFVVEGPAAISQDSEGSYEEDIDDITTEEQTQTSVQTEAVTSNETQSETQQSLPQEYIPPQTEQSTTEVSTQAPESSVTEENADSDSALFSYSQGEGDYNNEEALQYTFSPYDYMSEQSQMVDIEVEVSSTGSAQGGIGMLTSEGWTIYSCSTYGGEQTWVANGVDLSDVSGDVAVQIYYLKNNSDFSIKSISVTDVYGDVAADGSGDTAENTDTTTTTAETPTTTTAAETPTTTTTTTTTTVQTAEPEQDTDISGETDKDANVNVDTDTDTDGGLADSETTADGDSQNAESERTDSDSENNEEFTGGESETDSNASVSDSDTSDSAGSGAQSVVESTVESAAEQADANPGTGSSTGVYIRFGIILLCLAQISYSIYALTRKTAK